jgi:hypothetical protein
VDQAETVASRPASSRAWYSAPISEFRRTSAETILGQIAKHAEYDVVLTQRNTWLTQIEILRTALDELSGDIFFEFTVPRLGRRIDVVLLLGGTVVAIEFKIGERDFKRAALDQVWDYALDLKNQPVTPSPSHRF